ncbi:hypothetical protein MBLNU230_g3769t1 [Neophaeotheca triangularis]
MADAMPIFKIFKRTRAGREMPVDKGGFLQGFLDKMPREMRDAVWEACGEDTREVKMGTSPHDIYGKLENSMNTALLQTSRDVSEEYRQMLKWGATLVIRDHEDFEFRNPVLPTLPYINQLRKIHLKLIVFCNKAIHVTSRQCGAEYETIRHLHWIYSLLHQLPSLDNFAIDVFMCYAEVEAGCEKPIPCEGIMLRRFQWLIGLPFVTKVRIFRHDHTTDPDLEGTTSKLYCYWTPDMGNTVMVVPKKEEPKKAAVAAKNETPGDVQQQQQQIDVVGASTSASGKTGAKVITIEDPAGSRDGDQTN